jgi:voltage-gated potassium channel
MARFKVVERRFGKFLHTPLSVRRAMAVIVAATFLSVLLGGAMITIFDHKEFPDFGTGLWWALQTVTTVGYGDVTPETAVGQVIGALFMLEAIAFVTIVTAVITSSFIERARQERAATFDATETADVDQLTAQLAEISARLDRIQRTLERGESAGVGDG